MGLLSVDKDLCTHDEICAAVCPVGIIEFDAEDLPRIEDGPASLCVRCGHCVASCPSGALSHAELAAGDFVPAQRRSAIRPETLAGLLRSRRSVRRYKAEPVPRETLARLIDAARFAPTAINTQHVRWIVSEDIAATRNLASLAMDWLRESGGRPRLVEAWDQGQEVVLRGAPHVAVAIAPADSLWAATDCAIAVSFLELMAHVSGLGACWAGLLLRATASHPPLARALGLPEGFAALGALMLGRPEHRFFLAPPRRAAHVTWLAKDKETR